MNFSNETARMTNAMNAEIDQAEREYQDACAAIDAEVSALAEPVKALRQMGYDHGHRAQWEADFSAANAIYAAAWNAASDHKHAIRIERDAKQDAIQAPRYWTNTRGALLTSPLERKGWTEIDEETYHAIKHGMEEAAAYWSGSASAKGPRADITR